MKADPDAARRRREEAEKDPRVQLWREDAGTAAICGYGLPPDAALAAGQAITTAALDLKAAGLPGTMDQLRARAYLDALLGQDSRPAPASPPPRKPPPRRPSARKHPGAETPGRRRRCGARQHGSPRRSPEASVELRHGAPRHGDLQPGGRRRGARCWLTRPGRRKRPRGNGRAGGVPETARPPRTAPAAQGAHRPGRPHGPAGPGKTARQTGPPPAAAINLTIPLTTLLGLTGHPGEAAAFGPIDAALARALAAHAAGNPATTWCLTVTDEHGHPTAHRCAQPTRRGKPRRTKNPSGPPPGAHRPAR